METIQVETNVLSLLLRRILNNDIAGIYNGRYPSNSLTDTEGVSPKSLPSGTLLKVTPINTTKILVLDKNPYWINVSSDEPVYIHGLIIKDISQSINPDVTKYEENLILKLNPMQELLSGLYLNRYKYESPDIEYICGQCKNDSGVLFKDEPAGLVIAQKIFEYMNNSYELRVSIESMSRFMYLVKNKSIFDKLNPEMFVFVEPNIYKPDNTHKILSKSYEFNLATSSELSYLYDLKNANLLDSYYQINAGMDPELDHINKELTQKRDVNKENKERIRDELKRSSYRWIYEHKYGKPMSEKIDKKQQEQLDISYKKYLNRWSRIQNNTCTHLTINNKLLNSKSARHIEKNFNDLYRFAVKDKKPHLKNDFYKCFKCGFDVICPHLVEYYVKTFKNEKFVREYLLKSYSTGSHADDGFYCKICSEKLSERFDMEKFTEYAGGERIGRNIESDPLEESIWGEIRYTPHQLYIFTYAYK